MSIDKRGLPGGLTGIFVSFNNGEIRENRKNEQNLSEKIRENQGFFALNIGGNPVIFYVHTFLFNVFLVFSTIYLRNEQWTIGSSGVPQGSIVGPTLLLLYINDLPDDVICNIAELESDLQDIVDWGRKWLVDFSAGKTQLVSFDQSNNNGSLDVKMDGSVLEEKSSFKMLGLTFPSKLDWGSYIISIA